MQLTSIYKTIKNSVLMLAFLLSSNSLSFGRQVGEPGKVALRVAELQQSGTTFRSVGLFQPASSQFDEQVSNTIRKYTLLNMNASALNTLLQGKPEHIRVSVPANNGTSVNVLLYKVNISGNGFTLLTSDGRSFNELNTIVHYRGIIENDMNSVVSFSFSQEETAGILSNDLGNFVLGRLENAHGNQYVFYNDKDLIPAFNYDCGTNTTYPAKNYQQQNNNNNPNTMTVKCVDWYYEIDYDIYVGKGSDIAVVNSYIQNVFNQVSTLYDNDGISITLHTLFVWTAVDPYTGPSTSNYLTQFGNFRTSFAGDLANLIGYNGGGGIAWLDQLCGSSVSHKMSYSGINSTVNTVPTYSWTAEVVTHEDGHLLGSNHTHDCVWGAGNNTAIDGCGDAAGYNGSGSCSTGPLPTNGTIMSYCHLVSGVGINFNNGFGPLPTARILNEVNNASCLSACTTCQPPSQPGTISGATTYCGSSSQTYSIAAVSGATSYIWTKPSGWTGTSTTNSITVTTSGTGGTLSVTAVNSCGDSPIRNLTVTGNTTPSQPGNLVGSTSVCQGSSQAYSVGAVSGATAYVWTKPSGWTGTSTTNNITLVAGSTGGTVSVAAINSCGTGTTRSITISVNTLPAQPGTISGNAAVCAGTSQTYSISAVSGATSYNWTLPSGWTGSSTTNSISVTPAPAGGTISVAANNSCGTGATRTLTVTTNAVPGQPGTISGTTAVCINTSYVYSVSVVPGASSYTWQLPSGWSGTSTTNTITVVSGTLGGTLSVVASNACGAGIARTATITIATAPAVPGTITATGGNTKVCPGDTKTYSVAAVSGATSYQWTPPPGSIITNGQGTTAVTVSYQAGFVASDSIKVRASNGCALSAVRFLKITRNTPGKPSAIAGTVYNVCNGNNIPYSVTNVAGITYNWTYNSGSATVTSGQGTSAIGSTFTPNFVSAILSVTANNGCGTSAARALTIYAKPAQPGLITGTTTPCSAQQGVPYSIAPLAGINSYTWNVPAGATINDGNVTSAGTFLTTTATSVTVNFGTTAGYVRAKANNACGTGSNRSMLVSFGCREANPGIESDLEVEVYPNPVKEDLHIQFESANESKHNVRLYDPSGKTYLQQNGTSTSGVNELHIDIRQMAPGIYFLEVQNDGSQYVSKIVVE